MKFILILTLIIFPFFSFGETFKIEMLLKHERESMLFKPAFLKVQPGDTIIFIPTDKGHTSQSVFTPLSSTSWKGETSKEVTVTLEKEGLYIFECKNHAIMGMIGLIQVGQTKSLEQTKEFFEKYKKKIIINKKRLNTFFQNVDE